jgi:hypothetical protein
MSNSDSRNSSHACKNVFFLVRVLVKARFLDSKAMDSKSMTVLFTTRYQRTYVENFSSLGAIAAEKEETDGQQIDFNRAHFFKMCSKNQDGGYIFKKFFYVVLPSNTNKSWKNFFEIIQNGGVNQHGGFLYFFLIFSSKNPNCSQKSR